MGVGWKVCWGGDGDEEGGEDVGRWWEGGCGNVGRWWFVEVGKGLVDWLVGES